MKAQEISLKNLLLDPNNYRLQEQSGFVSCAEDRFHNERVQSGTYERLKKESLKILRDSIVANGFLPIERIVVSPYAHEIGKYLVIEGNRRVAALMMIRDEHEAGIEIPENVVAVLEAVPCIVADDDGQAAYFRETLMGIRHVGGIKEWGGFQRAKLIADLKDDHNVEASDISQKIGLTTQEVNRRYRAYKALQQMQEDETYSEFATGNLYHLFHEAVALPIVREWLGWSAESNKFENLNDLENFYKLITPGTDENDGKEIPPKLNSYQDVRALREILPNPEAKADLLNPERKLHDALSIASRSAISHRWRNEVQEAITALTNIPALSVESFEEQDLKTILNLIETAQRVLRIHTASKKG